MRPGGPGANGACAASVVAARAATCRGAQPSGACRTVSNSRPSRMARVQRGTVTQVDAAVAPTVAQGLTRLRTSGSDWPAKPKSASASAMAGAENSRCVSVSRGATVTVAPHLVHR